MLIQYLGGSSYLIGTYDGWAVGTTVVDELVHTVRVIGEVCGHRSLGQCGVEFLVDESLEVASDACSI